MSFLNLFKKLSILALLSLAVACASSPKVDDSVTETAAQEAIASATSTISSGNEIGADTSAAQALLDQANAAFAEGDYAKAAELAAQAEAEANAAIAARRAEIELAETAAAAAAEVEDTSSSSYEVVSGDNLWRIAGSSSVYGNPYQWPLLYKANKGQIKDADLIFPGQVLDVVSGSASEIEAAVQHAKTRGAWSIGTAEDSDAAYLAQ